MLSNRFLSCFVAFEWFQQIPPFLMFSKPRWKWIPPHDIHLKPIHAALTLTISVSVFPFTACSLKNSMMLSWNKFPQATSSPRKLRALQMKSWLPSQRFNSEFSPEKLPKPHRKGKRRLPVPPWLSGAFAVKLRGSKTLRCASKHKKLGCPKTAHMIQPFSGDHFFRGGKWAPRNTTQIKHVGNYSLWLWQWVGATDSPTVDGSEIRLTSWYGKYPIIYMVFYIPGGAGLLPSTVSSSGGSINFWAIAMNGIGCLLVITEPTQWILGDPYPRFNIHIQGPRVSATHQTSSKKSTNQSWWRVFCSRHPHV